MNSAPCTPNRSNHIGVTLELKAINPDTVTIAQAPITQKNSQISSIIIPPNQQNSQILQPAFPQFQLSSQISQPIFPQYQQNSQIYSIIICKTTCGT